jgi:hypothetical protein
VTAVAKGVIEAAAVCARPATTAVLAPPASTTGCAASSPSFQALSGAGALVVTVRNAGAVSAQFTVTVSRCSGGVLDPPAGVVALPPGGGAVLEFPLAATSAAAVAAAGCEVGLLDAAGAVTASLAVQFAINATDVGPPPVDPGGGGTGPGSGRAGRAACVAACPSWWRDFGCRLKRRCWREVLASVVAGVGVAGVVGVAVVGCVRGWWWRAARACCACCCGGRRRRRGVGGGLVGV